MSLICDSLTLPCCYKMMSLSSDACIKPVPSVSIFMNISRSSSTSCSVAVFMSRFMPAFLRIDTPLYERNLFRTSSLNYADSMGHYNLICDALMLRLGNFLNQVCAIASWIDSRWSGSVTSSFLMRSMHSGEITLNSLWLKWYWPAIIFFVTSAIFVP